MSEEKFEKEYVRKVGRVKLKLGTLREVEPWIEVEIYTKTKTRLGPIMLTLDFVNPKNKRLSKPKAFMHLEPRHALGLMTLLVKAICRVMPALKPSDVMHMLRKCIYNKVFPCEMKVYREVAE